MKKIIFLLLICLSPSLSHAVINHTIDYGVYGSKEAAFAACEKYKPTICGDVDITGPYGHTTNACTILPGKDVGNGTVQVKFRCGIHVFYVIAKFV